MTGPTRRWDADARGVGIGDGGWIRPSVQAALDALTEPGWIAEDPDAHLLPHLRRAAAAAGSPWTLVGAALHDAVYVVDLEWSRPNPRLRDLRTDAHALIGEIAEGFTFVRQQIAGERIEYHVATGLLAGDSPFTGHGHQLRLVIGGAPIKQVVAGTKPNTG